MKKIEFSLGKKKEIIAMYEDKTIPVKEILETYHISQAVLNRILREEKVPFRIPKATGKRTNIHHRRCDTCNSFITVKDALFCPYCGADIRSKGERLAMKLGDLWNLLYPNFKDYEEKTQAKKIFEELTTYLKENK